MLRCAGKRTGEDVIVSSLYSTNTPEKKDKPKGRADGDILNMKTSKGIQKEDENKCTGGIGDTAACVTTNKEVTFTRQRCAKNKFSHSGIWDR